MAHRDNVRTHDDVWVPGMFWPDSRMKLRSDMWKVSVKIINNLAFLLSWELHLYKALHYMFHPSPLQSRKAPLEPPSRRASKTTSRWKHTISFPVFEKFVQILHVNWKHSYCGRVEHWISHPWFNITHNILKVNATKTTHILLRGEKTYCWKQDLINFLTLW